MATVSTVSPATAAPAAPEALRAKAEELESVFLAQILRELMQGLTGPLGNAEDDPFAAMLQDEYAKLISRSGGIGIADAVLREMLKAQEAA
ncbi:rod-binding protein [Benzoatithermus flavus]|uniref:Rod-binding protein n=1 Tax=Benzoatithermus flavus TaxID=3108223 RepID=A0ABU8XV31_9PROT